MRAFVSHFGNTEDVEDRLQQTHAVATRVKVRPSIRRLLF